MCKLTSLFVCGFLFLQQAQGAVVEVEVTIKSIDVEARGLTVTYETKLGHKSIDLDVSRKANITVNGASGTLDSLRPGQKAKVTYEQELQVVTKVVATGSGSVMSSKRPELVECSELNDEGGNDNPWLSEDGLTIYWDRDLGGKLSIWTARREDARSLFTDKKMLFPGRLPTTTADGLEMVFRALRTDGQPGSCLYATTRNTANSPFRRPSRISELMEFSPWSPCLSGDGLTLYFNDTTKTGVVSSTRPNRSSPWGRPRPFASIESASLYLTPDGRHLLGTEIAKNQRLDRSNLWVWSRSSTGEQFHKSSRIEFAGCPPIFGGCVRYVASTKEVFFSRILKDGKPTGIWLIKNFDLPED
jgi:hypothetical protein